MSGVLKDDIVVVADQKEGCQIFNKGNYGYPLSGGGVNLDLLEATYLLESKRLDVTLDGRNMTFGELFDHSSKVHEDFDIRYMVYRDIRQRGFVIKNESSEFDFSVFPRGKIISNSRPQYLVKAVSERTASPMDVFAREVEQISKMGRQLLYGVVDEEGDITYYVISTREPKGTVFAKDMSAVNGRLIRDRVFVFDHDEASALHGNGYFGKPVEGMLQLSLIESCYLTERGMLNVRSSDKDMTFTELKEFSDSVQNEFTVRFRTFSDMRDRGLLVKTGFKYGTHFRVYEKQPDECHARYLVHSLDDGQTMTWPEISRTVRLAHGVKKEILFSTPGTGEYVEFRRFRP